MTLELLFWILVLLALVFGLIQNFRGQLIGPYGPLGNLTFIFILIIILGCKVFGMPLHG